MKTSPSQKQNGNIDALKGTILKGIKYLYNNLSEKEDILMIWLKTGQEKWIRIYIDGSICNINEYLFDESNSHLDENISVVDYSKWVIDTEIISAQVETLELSQISLTIHLSGNKKINFACDKTKKCTIKFLTTDPH